MEAITENQPPATEETGERYDYPLFRDAVMNGFAGANADGVQPANPGVALPQQSAEPNQASPNLRMVDVGLQRAGTDAVPSAPKSDGAVQTNRMSGVALGRGVGQAAAKAGAGANATVLSAATPSAAPKPSGGGQTPNASGMGAKTAGGSAQAGASSLNPAGSGATAGSSAKQQSSRVQPAGQSPAPNSSQKPVNPNAETWLQQTLHQTEDLMGIPRGTVQASGQSKTQTLDPNAKRGTPGSAQYNLAKAQDDARNDPANKPDRDKTKWRDVKKGGVVQMDPTTGKAAQENPITATHCNRATYQVVKAMGGELSPLASQKVGKDGKVAYTPYDANTQCANLAKDAANPKGSYRVITAKEAIELARQGKAVIAAQPHEGHGHVATVRPDNLETEKVETRGQPLINNVGGHVEVTHQTGAFFTKPPVVYYVQR